MYMNEVCEMPYCKNIDIDEQIEFIGNTERELYLQASGHS